MQPEPHDDFNDKLFMAGILLLGSISGSTYAGAWLAAKLTAPREFTPTFGEAMTAALHLPEHRGNPRLAWPEEHQAALPGPFAYWTVTGLILLLVVGVAVWIAMRKWGKDTLDHRERLGVDTQARTGSSSAAIGDAGSASNPNDRPAAAATGVAVAEAPSPTSAPPSRARPPTSSTASSTSAGP